MKKYIIPLFLTLMCMQHIQAQQRPQFTQYFMSPYLMNPAATGIYDYTDLRAGFRNQWTGFEDAPRTAFVSGHFKFKGNQFKPLPTIGTFDYHGEEAQKGSSGLNHGVGGHFIYDQTGAVSRMMLYGSYALHFSLGKKLEASIGVHGGFIQYRQNNSKLISEPDPDFPSPPIDPALQGDISSSLIPDAAIGAFVRGERFYVGFATSQVFQNNLSYSDVQFTPDNQLFMHTFITGGYKLPFGGSKQHSFIPTTTVKILKASPVSVDLNALCNFQLSETKESFKNLWFGTSYRYKDGLAAILGFSISRDLDFNYSYDYPLTEIRHFQTGTHEFTLGFKLNNTKFGQNFNLFKND